MVPASSSSHALFICSWMMACSPLAAESVARTWNEQNLAAIRIDFPNPPVHARNLFHTSVAMYDAWAAYDAEAVGYIHREEATAGNVEAARHEAISYAAYRVLSHRYALSVNAATSQAALDQQMVDLGYPIGTTTESGPDPAAVGNRVASAIINFFLNDGSNQTGNYLDGTYAPLNDPLILDLPFESMVEPNYWQPLAFEFAFTQNGLETSNVQTFVGSAWGDAWPFALHLRPGENVYHDPGVPPLLGAAGDGEFKANSVDVIRFSRKLDPDEAPTLDYSPGAIGNNTLGTNDGDGHPLNPATLAPYSPNPINEADFGRCVAEFWADGPESETPPGHWNTLANEAVDHPSFTRQLGGSGPVLGELEWDVKMYFALNGAVHDAAVAAWDCKREYDYVRPISSIRQLSLNGQSTDPLGPSYHPQGIPLEPGFIEVISAESIQPGERHAHMAAHVGKIAIYAWGGEPANPETQYTGNKWQLGIRWLPYQRDTFVTPAFAGYVSGHSCFSRAAAEVLTAMTGSPFFPGGMASHTINAGELDFEFGPSASVTLQWATYYDAADQAGISRLYGGIHVAPDDGPGRIIGSACGKDAWGLAMKYFDGSILDEVPEIRMVKAGGGLRVEWEQHRGLYHRLQRSQSLSGWVDVLPPYQPGTDKGAYDFAPNTHDFYRIVTSPTP